MIRNAEKTNTEKKSPAALRNLCKAKRQMSIATCLVCGCDDIHACIDRKSGMPCGWAWVDYEGGIGVCTQCQKVHREVMANLRVIFVHKGQGRPTTTLIKELQEGVSRGPQRAQ